MGFPSFVWLLSILLLRLVSSHKAVSFIPIIGDDLASDSAAANLDLAIMRLPANTPAIRMPIIRITTAISIRVKAREL